MLKDLVEMSKILESKTSTMVEEARDMHPTTKDYETLLNNFAASMQLISVINRTVQSIAVSVAKEESNDESNN